MSAQAELVADGGRAASGAEFFRSPGFLSAEGVTHSLRVGELAVPLVVSEIPGSDRTDASSPYGYPGGSTTRALDPAGIDFSATGLISVFVRDRVGEATCLSGGTMRTEVQIADPSLPRKSRMSDRQQIRRNLRDGWAIETLPGETIGDDAREGFERAYGETMKRTGASERYLFSSDYFRQVLSADGVWLLVARAPDGEVGAGSIATRSDGYLHYYLSGTAEPYLSASPMKNLIESMIGLAAELELPLNLGGGATPGDSLEAFKRGFANRQEPFFTHEVVADAEAYEELSGGRDAGGFFPAYRAPAPAG